MTLEDDTTEKLEEGNAEVHLDQEVPPPTEPVDIIVSYGATPGRLIEVNKDSLCILEDISLQIFVAIAVGKPVVIIGFA